MESIQPVIDYAKDNAMIVAGMLIAVLVIIYFAYTKYYAGETMAKDKKKPSKDDNSEDSSETDELIEKIHKKQAK